MTRIAVARLWFEGNRFAPSVTTRADFERREWRTGEAALAASAGTATELAAVVDAAAARPGWRLEALRCASALPGGPIDESVFSQWLDEVLHGLRRLRPDGVYLSLHGAAITTARDTPETDVLRAVRSAVGDVPVVASFDLHGNLDPTLAQWLDFATVYRTYPHVDMRETATRALDALAAMLDGAARPVGAIVPAGHVLPSFNMRTDDDPMRGLLARARAAEDTPVDGGRVLEVSLFGGFPYADTVHTGGSVMAWVRPDHDGHGGSGSGDARARAHAAAHAIAQTMATAMADRAPAFEPRLLSARDGLLRALAAPPGLVAVTDPADNPLSGGAADTPGLFAALLALRREPGGPVNRLPAGAVAFACFADPPLVARATNAGAGSVLDVALGATRGAAFGAAVPARARVLRITDGRFVNTGPMERGAPVDVGRSVVLDVEGILTVVCEAPGPCNDPGFFALHGILPEATRLLCVKAKNHFRAAFAPLCRTIVDVDCPGPAAADLRMLPFARARLAMRG